jgi:nitrilase
VNERSPVSLGAIYNTLVFIGPDGALLGKHRKLVPTWAEKLTWTGGDGSSLRVYDTEIGRLGGLACGENTNTLARFALLGQGELVHVASYISLPVAPPDYDMAEAIKLRAIALIDDEGIVYADIDLERCIQPKQMHDIVGHYNRFDIFDLRVNRRPLTPLGLMDEERVAGDAGEQAGFSSIPGKSE